MKTSALSLHSTYLHSNTQVKIASYYTTNTIYMTPKKYSTTTHYYTTLHYSTLNYSTLLHTTLHYTTRHDTTRHDTTRHDTTRHDTTLAALVNTILLHLNFTPLTFSTRDTPTYTTLSYIITTTTQKKTSAIFTPFNLTAQQYTSQDCIILHHKFNLYNI